MRKYLILFFVASFIILTILFSINNEESLSGENIATNLDRDNDLLINQKNSNLVKLNKITQFRDLEKNISEHIQKETNINKDTIKFFSTVGNLPVWNGNNYSISELKEELYIDKDIFAYNLIDPYEAPVVLLTVKGVDSGVVMGYAKASFKNGKYTINSFNNVQEYNITSYPTLSSDDAKNLLREKNIDIDNLEYQNDLVHINGDPLYHFKHNNQNYYVDIEKGYVYDDKFVENYINRQRIKAGKELKYYLDKNGEVVLDKSQIIWDYWTAEEINEIEKELEVHNQAIRDGLLKLDENLNLIFDKRKR